MSKPAIVVAVLALLLQLVTVILLWNIYDHVSGNFDDRNSGIDIGRLLDGGY